MIFFPLSACVLSQERTSALQGLKGTEVLPDRSCQEDLEKGRIFSSHQNQVWGPLRSAFTMLSKRPQSAKTDSSLSLSVLQNDSHSVRHEQPF